MSIPNGYQPPKTDWNSSDAPSVEDFNRIEGNAQAIETGARTLDPAAAPSGNSGTLRQLLGWFANRLTAITGKTNWWTSPATTLEAAKAHMDAAAPHSGHETPGGAQAKVDAHAGATAVHGATSVATANRLVLRDGSGNIAVGTATAGGHAVNRDTGDGRYARLAAANTFAGNQTVNGAWLRVQGAGDRLVEFLDSSGTRQGYVARLGTSVTLYNSVSGANIALTDGGGITANGHNVSTEGRANTFTQTQVLNNNVALMAKNTSGTNRIVAFLGADNVMILGDLNHSINIRSNGTFNHNGNAVWDASRLRTTNGYLEVNIGGTWLPVGGVMATKPKAASLVQSSPTQNTWYTVVDVVSGRGKLNHIALASNHLSNGSTQIRVTADGVPETFMVGYNYARGIARDSYDHGLYNAANNWDVFFDVTFLNNMKVEVRRTSTFGDLHSVVDYAIT